jgi:GT2 family glycosyltransferase
MVDVVIPTFNNGTEVIRCLEALGTQRAAIRALVCVDGSTDDTAAAVASRAWPFEVTVLTHPDGLNHGRAAARNLALPHLRAPVTVFLDSDLVADPGLIAGHVALLSERDCVSIGDVQYLPGSSVWARYLTTRGRYRIRPRGDARVLDTNTQNLAMRTEHLLAVGGFDDRLSAYGGEDTELGFRLASVRKLPFVYNTDSVARTLETKSIQKGLDQFREYGATNLRAIRRLHPDLPPPLMIQRAESPKLGDRLFRLALNRPSQSVARRLVDRVPFPVQRRLLNYLVIGAVFDGYRNGLR